MRVRVRVTVTVRVTVRIMVTVTVTGRWLGIRNILRLGLGLDFHFSVWVSVLQSTFVQLLSACDKRERKRVDAIFDSVLLDEALR